MQRAIADFLEEKTAAIDALIARKERLLALLDEKRQALITQAVTKGLDPSVPMKNSGVEWLGEIPATWRATSLRRVITKIEQGWSPVAEDRETEEFEWGVLRLSAIKRGRYIDSEHKALPAGLAPEVRFEVKVGDLLVTRSNTPDTVGDAAVVRATRGRLMMSDLVYRLRPTDEADRDYLMFSILGSHVRAQIEADARGTSMSMAKVSQGHIKGWVIALPSSVTEQRKIAVEIRAMCERIAHAAGALAASVERLREYRQALITAAVTDQLDVRSKQARAMEPAA